MKPYYQDKFTTIFHADCREILPDLEPVDLVLTDPPYGINGAGKVQMRGGVASTDYANDSELPLWWIPMVRTSACVVFTDIREITTIIGALEKAGLMHKRTIIWDKGDSGINPRGNFVNAFEAAVYHRSNGALWYGDGSTINVIRRNRCPTPFHPTQKPIEVMRYIANSTSNQAQTILDPFMGSGTTLVAAKQLQRRAIGIELEEKYCEIAADRLRQGVLELF